MTGTSDFVVTRVRGETAGGLRHPYRHRLLGGGNADLKGGALAGLRHDPGPGTGAGEDAHRPGGPALELVPQGDRRVADRHGEVGTANHQQLAAPSECSNP